MKRKDRQIYEDTNLFFNGQPTRGVQGVRYDIKAKIYGEMSEMFFDGGALS